MSNTGDQTYVFLFSVAFDVTAIIFLVHVAFFTIPSLAANQNVCHERTRTGKVSANEGTRHDNSNCSQQIQVKMFFCFYNKVMFFVFYNKVMEFNSRWLSTPSC